MRVENPITHLFRVRDIGIDLVLVAVAAGAAIALDQAARSESDGLAHDWEHLVTGSDTCAGTWHRRVCDVEHRLDAGFGAAFC